MTPAAEPPAEEDGAAEEETPPAPEQEAEPETDTGYIQVRTFTARQAIPVPGAVVTITRKNGDKDELVRIMQTDISGLSPVVAVPTVSRELSLQPGNHPSLYRLYHPVGCRGILLGAQPQRTGLRRYNRGAAGGDDSAA